MIAGLASHGLNDRVQSYQNICNILAKDDYAHLAPGAHISRLKSNSNSPARQTMQQFGEKLEADNRIKK